MDYKIKKIIVLGSPGAGKTWLSNKLSEITGIEAVHLDDYYWRDYWISLTEEEWKKQLNELLKKDRYIMDGNYSSTIPLRVSHADRIIYVERSLFGCLYGFTRRCVINLLCDGKELPKNISEGNTKKITDNGYLNFVFYIIKFHLKEKKKLAEYLSGNPKVIQIEHNSKIDNVINKIFNF